MARLQTDALRVCIADVQVCDGLDLQVRPGESWCILGRNGAGKTTLLHTLAGLREPYGGTILLDDRPLQKLSRRHIARPTTLAKNAPSTKIPAKAIKKPATDRAASIQIRASSSSEPPTRLIRKTSPRFM